MHGCVGLLMKPEQRLILKKMLPRKYKRAQSFPMSSLDAESKVNKKPETKESHLMGNDRADCPVSPSPAQ